MAVTSSNNRLKLIAFISFLLLEAFLFTRDVIEPDLLVRRLYWFKQHEPQGSSPLSSSTSKVPLDDLYVYPSLSPETNSSNLVSENSASEGPEQNSTVALNFTSDIEETTFLPSVANRNAENSSAALESIAHTNKTNSDSSTAKHSCDLYSGNWVRDNQSYPLYQSGSCPHIDDAFSCQVNGRKDFGYQKWRWKPHGCEIPSFNATDFLERLRGKRMMLVGDSMNRNQFESMLCLLREALPDKSRMFETRGHKISKGRGYFIFQFMDYNCTIEFCRSHYLVREGTQTTAKGRSRPILQIDRIDKSSSRWKHADILIFNTGHWWTHRRTSKGKNYYQEGDFVHPQLDAVEAYTRAMKTWAKWIDENMDSPNTMIFYRGYSSAHFRGGDWDSGGTCKGETEPIFEEKALQSYPVKMQIVQRIISNMVTRVFLLNITKMTNARKDGHPSIYRNVLSAGKGFSRRQDCSHWCLPGVPDAWNELVYATLVTESLKNQR